MKPIVEWRALGASAAWNAIYDMLGWWFEAWTPKSNG
jgi:hypothetical protein